MDIQFQQIEDYKIARIQTELAHEFLNQHRFIEAVGMPKTGTYLDDLSVDPVEWMRPLSEVPHKHQDWFIVIHGDDRIIFGVDSRDRQFLNYWNLKRSAQSSEETQFIEEVFRLKALHSIFDSSTSVEPLCDILLVGADRNIFPKDLYSNIAATVDSTRVCHGLDRLIKLGIPISPNFKVTPISLEQGEDFLKETSKRDVIFICNVDCNGEIADAFEKKTAELNPKAVVVYGYSFCRHNPFQIHGHNVCPTQTFARSSDEREFAENFFDFCVQKDFLAKIAVDIRSSELLEKIGFSSIPSRPASSVPKNINMPDFFRIIGQ